MNITTLILTQILRPQKTKKKENSCISMETWIKINHEGVVIVRLRFVPHIVLDAFLTLFNTQGNSSQCAKLL